MTLAKCEAAHTRLSKSGVPIYQGSDYKVFVAIEKHVMLLLFQVTNGGKHRNHPSFVIPHSYFMPAIIACIIAGSIPPAAGPIIPIMFSNMLNILGGG